MDLWTDEQRLFVDAVRCNAGSDRDRALAMLLFELGVNTEVAARIWNDGLLTYAATRNGSNSDLVEFHLAVPRAKKRTEARECRVRPISVELGTLLARLRRGHDQQRLLNWFTGDHPDKAIRRALQRWVEAAGIISPRTGEPLRLTPRRLRYTLATEMARDGASRERIAELLDHSDLQNVEVYIEASSYIVQQVAERFDAGFAPYARRFRGQIVSSDDPAPFAGLPRRVVPGAVVQLPMLPVDVGGIGACGRDVMTDGLCELAPPLSCYGCDKFAAFREAPHRLIGDNLGRLIDQRMGGEADRRIPMQLEDTVLAIRQLDAQIAREASQ